MATETEGARKVIIDCDAGTDDAQAILMALATPDVDVIAITATSGNCSVDNASNNVLRVLKLVNRHDVSYSLHVCSLRAVSTLTQAWTRQRRAIHPW